MVLPIGGKSEFMALSDRWLDGRPFLFSNLWESKEGTRNHEPLWALPAASPVSAKK
jgi:hypothetical protein